MTITSTVPTFGHCLENLYNPQYRCIDQANPSKQYGTIEHKAKTKTVDEYELGTLDKINTCESQVCGWFIL